MRIKAAILFYGTTEAFPFNSLHAGLFFMLLLSSADFFNVFKNLFQEHYLSVKWFGSRS